MGYDIPRGDAVINLETIQVMQDTETTKNKGELYIKRLTTSKSHHSILLIYRWHHHRGNKHLCTRGDGHHLPRLDSVKLRHFKRHREAVLCNFYVLNGTKWKRFHKR